MWLLRLSRRCGHFPPVVVCLAVHLHVFSMWFFVCLRRCAIASFCILERIIGRRYCWWGFFDMGLLFRGTSFCHEFDVSIKSGIVLILIAFGRISMRQ